MKPELIRAIVTAHIQVTEAISKIRKASRGCPEPDNLLGALGSFDAGASLILRKYARSLPAGGWAMDVGIPDYVAAGLVSGVGLPIADADALVSRCGVEPRRYVTPNLAKEAIAKVAGFGSRPIPIDQVRAIAKIIDRRLIWKEGHATPGKRLEIPREEVHLWATSPKHSEFLRELCLTLGDWIARNPQAPYHSIYSKTLDDESAKSLQDDQRRVTLGQIEYRAKVNAIRAFLRDYAKELKATGF